MAVVGRREFYAEAFSDFPKPPVYPALLLKGDCLYFKIVAVPEYLFVDRSDSYLLLLLLFENGLGKFAAHAPGEDRKPLENSLFVVRFPGSGPIIKRIRFDVNGYLAVADNPAVPDLVVPQEMFRQEEVILGRVRWIYNKL